MRCSAASDGSSRFSAILLERVGGDVRYALVHHIPDLALVDEVKHIFGRQAEPPSSLAHAQQSVAPAR